MTNIFNKRSASKALGISIETLDKFRKKGSLPFHRIGDQIIFTEDDLLAFLKKCSIPATADLSNREKLEMAKATTEGKK